MIKNTVSGWGQCPSYARESRTWSNLKLYVPTTLHPLDLLQICTGVLLQHHSVLKNFWSHENPTRHKQKRLCLKHPQCVGKLNLFEARIHFFVFYALGWLFSLCLAVRPIFKYTTRTAAFHPNGCPGITAALLLLRNPDSEACAKQLEVCSSADASLIPFMHWIANNCWLQDIASCHWYLQKVFSFKQGACYVHSGSRPPRTVLDLWWRH